MFNNFRGLLYFKCVGEAPEILINLMKNANIVWFDVKRQKDTVSGIIYKRDYSALKNFSEKAKMELSIERKKGFIFKALRYKKRYGILAGFLLACFFIFFMSNTVLTIEIEGNNLVSRDKILSVLKNNGITEGKFIPNINFRNVERNVTTSFKNIAFAAVRSKGGRVIVEVDEVEEPPYIIPRNIPCN
ncbi:MAG: sporulation protein YqfD, partial [Oscillospiraceae bacterium]